MRRDQLKKVLIVEDDMIISMVLERMINKMGFDTVEKAVTGKKAISLAQEHEPDIILMDIQLKDDIDGITAMQKIRESSDVPVIYITGNSDQYYKERARETNYIDYLIKPIEMDDLKTSIDKIFGS
ncbi:Response regulator receiver domain-containing protein [Fodinibius roseus]|uniref:Response regulator receiver domain-containing protein n=1 Tax=Fodinibius roseus TaxID=1194090 RepID=A0A1M5HZ38_9BACT|nr:response regulator [Fodinibius roseus]SHG21261.1 Response regulator receiver domain-containing protein [Fodinibius roseus]